MKKPRVAVVVPVHNGAKTLERTLENLAAQTFRDLSVIIAENGSTDDTLSIAQAFCDKDPRFSIDISTICLPPVENFLRAMTIGSQRAEFFMLRAADDLSSIDYIDKLVAALDACETCMVAGGTTKIFGGPKGVRLKRPNPAIFGFKGRYASGEVPRNLTFPAQWIYGLFRSTAIDRLQKRWVELGTAWCCASFAVFDFVVHDELAYAEDAILEFREGSGSASIYGAKSGPERVRRRLDYARGCFACHHTLPRVGLVVKLKFLLMCWADSRRKTGYKLLGFL